MTRDEWRAAVAAARLPFSEDQLAILRPICRRMAQAAETEAAPAVTQQEPRPVTEPGRNIA